MIDFSFYKFNPSGNTTVFLEGRAPGLKAAAHFCRAAISGQGVGGEQAGFVDVASRSLEMGAGEFCANACRAFGALLDLQAPGKESCYAVKVSGMAEPVFLGIKGKSPSWRVSAGFPDPVRSIEDAGPKTRLVSLEGISHLLIEAESFPMEKHAEDLAKDLFAAAGMNDLPASGVVWWRKKGDELEILPFVQVPGSGSAMLESSCGSASLALAAILDAPDCEIRQPSGEILTVVRKKKLTLLEGNVTLVCEGRVWLPDYPGAEVGE